MAEPKTPQKILPFVGLICIDDFPVDQAMAEFANETGRVYMKSAMIPFIHTEYYNKEMGDRLFRQWAIFENLLMPEKLVQLKIKANEIEKKYLNDKGGRKINIDPGIISLSNLILASTKNYTHRIYLGQGIYGEVTLIYKDNKFHPLAWTYPDYQEKIALEFFIKAREVLKKRLTNNFRNLNV